MIAIISSILTIICITNITINIDIVDITVAIHVTIHITIHIIVEDRRRRLADALQAFPRRIHKRYRVLVLLACSAHRSCHVFVVLTCLVCFK